MSRYTKKRRRRLKSKLLIALAVLLAAIAGACVFIKYNVDPMILEISDNRIRSLCGNAVSNAVLEVMSENNTKDLVSVCRDGDGSIKSVELNSQLITELAQKITLSCQQKINEIGVDGIRIPLGSLSGITLFTGLGPDIKIRAYLVGSTETWVTSDFSAAGINQTLHRLYIDIKTTVAVAVPGLPSALQIRSRALMCEMVIIGQVPPTYLQSTTVGDMLDLVAK